MNLSNPGAQQWLIVAGITLMTVTLLRRLYLNRSRKRAVRPDRSANRPPGESAQSPAQRLTALADRLEVRLNDRFREMNAMVEMKMHVLNELLIEAEQQIARRQAPSEDPGPQVDGLPTDDAAVPNAERRAQADQLDRSEPPSHRSHETDLGATDVASASNRWESPESLLPLPNESSSDRGAESPSVPISRRPSRRSSEPRPTETRSPFGAGPVGQAAPSEEPLVIEMDRTALKPSARPAPRQEREPVSDDTASEPAEPKHALILSLAEEGLSARRISERTGRPIGEVELILGLDRRRRHAEVRQRDEG